MDNHISKYLYEFNRDLQFQRLFHDCYKDYKIDLFLDEVFGADVDQVEE